MTRFINQLLSAGYLFFAIISLIGIAQASTPVDFGENNTASIDTEAEMDTYTFSASSGDVILIRMQSSWSYGPMIKLYAPNGTLISYTTGYTTYATGYYSSISEITQTLPDAGEYTILAGDYYGENTGNYSIFVQRVNNPGNSIPIGFGENDSASIDTEAEMGTYTFSASSGDVVSIRMHSSWSYGPEIKLYAPNGTLISHADEYTGYSDYFSEITQELPDTGEYTILTGADKGGDVGSYSLSLDATVVGPVDSDYTVELYTGWNLISLPLVPQNTGIDSILSPINGNYSIVW